MVKKPWYPVVYMFVITAVFSSAVIGFSRYTGSRVQANRERSIETAVLKVLPDMYDPGLSAVELHTRFETMIEQPSERTEGAYVLRKNGQTAGYALPVQGQGFWADIKLIIGISPGLDTITGLSVYEQRETPGLGAEITNKAFTEQFQGLKVSSGDIPVSFKRPGTDLTEGEVHAVTGATQTSVRLEQFLNEQLNIWLKNMKSNKDSI